MRRKDREVTDLSTIIGIIDECDIIRLGLSDGDFPYIVPVNFAYTVEGTQICFYIHGAMEGKKYEMLKENPYCSFEMDIPLQMDCIEEMKDVTMRYKSVMGKCKVEFLDGEDKQFAIDSVIMARYKITKNFDYNREMVKSTVVAKLTVNEISAKVNPIRVGGKGVIVSKSIDATRTGFEESFKEESYYNKQTRDESHLRDILSFLEIKPGMKILDLGCGSGYLTFGIAKDNPCAKVTGLDIVTQTLINNKERADREGINNIEFVSYDGITFPFENETFDLIVTRYALHHFPKIDISIQEVARVIKAGGKFFISDPRPNECDESRFVDDYMQLKKDGHIKFYTKNEWNEICGRCGLEIEKSFDSQIRFPKKKKTAIGFTDVLSKHDKSIIDSYELEETEDEIWVTEQVNNILFQKK